MINIVVAMDLDGIIGQTGGGIPWGRGLKDDLARFKSLTWGHTVVMGRRTFTDDIQRPLPNRQNIILTRDSAFQAEGCKIIHDWDQVMKIAEQSIVFVIGGAEIYKLAHPVADHLYVTTVVSRFKGDIRYPCLPVNQPAGQYSLATVELYNKNNRNSAAFIYAVWERNNDDAD